ncbi:MAG: hypothetical protein R3B72_29485 [Polyangiaceae bacterium]
MVPNGVTKSAVACVALVAGLLVTGAAAAQPNDNPYGDEPPEPGRETTSGATDAASETGGDETGGDETGGDETGGDEPADATRPTPSAATAPTSASLGPPEPPPEDPTTSRGGEIQPWYLAGGVASVTVGAGLAAPSRRLGGGALDEVRTPRRASKSSAKGATSARHLRRGRERLRQPRLPSPWRWPCRAVALCKQRQQLIAVQLIAFPTSVVLTGLGALLMAEAFGEGPDDLQIGADVGPGRASFTIGAKF